VYRRTFLSYIRGGYESTPYPRFGISIPTPPCTAYLGIPTFPHSARGHGCINRAGKFSHFLPLFPSCSFISKHSSPLVLWPAHFLVRQMDYVFCPIVVMPDFAEETLLHKSLLVIGITLSNRVIAATPFLQIRMSPRRPTF
jgi:hypothetical protein